MNKPFGIKPLNSERPTERGVDGTAHGSAQRENFDRNGEREERITSMSDLRVGKWSLGGVEGEIGQSVSIRPQDIIPCGDEKEVGGWLLRRLFRLFLAALERNCKIWCCLVSNSAETENEPSPRDMGKGITKLKLYAASPDPSGGVSSRPVEKKEF